jgi:DNA-binding MarR family transcriptional regulator
VKHLSEDAEGAHISSDPSEDHGPQGDAATKTATKAVSGDPPFGQAVGFMLSQLGFETATRFGRLMAKVDLEPRQFALMRAIAGSVGRSQNEIAESLRIPPSSMVGVIDHLEKRGLVERRLHPTDRRSRLVHLTDLGHSVLVRATELAMGLEKTVCSGLDDTERQTLLGLLTRVADTLGLQRGLHPDTSTGHGRPHWTENRLPSTE